MDYGQLIETLRCVVRTAVAGHVLVDSTRALRAATGALELRWWLCAD